MCEQNTNNRHKWADVLIAIAEGREVQWNYNGQKWEDFNPSRHNAPSLQHPFGEIQWRVKPKIVRKYCYAYEAKNGLRNVTPPHYLNDDDFIDRNYVDKIVWFQRLDNSCVETEEV